MRFAPAGSVFALRTPHSALGKAQAAERRIYFWFNQMSSSTLNVCEPTSLPATDNVTL
jgi:hypothetical protein